MKRPTTWESHVQEAARISAALESVHARLERALGKDEGRRIYMLALTELKKSPLSAVEFVSDFAQPYIDEGRRS